MNYNYKYLKYKSKYLELKQHGGDINTSQCAKIASFLKNLSELINFDDYNKINKLINENASVILNSDSPSKHLIASIFYLLEIDIYKLNNQSIKNMVYNIYDIKKYSEPEADYTDFMSDIFLDQMGVWYTSYFGEYFWNSDLKIFMEEYYVFKKTNQSYHLYWLNLVNICMLFARITKCRFYTEFNIGTKCFPTKENKDSFNYSEKDEKKYSIKNNSDKTEECDKPSRHTYKLYEIENWNLVKNKLVTLLINSLDCNYSNIYNLYKKFLCFLHNNNNDETSVTRLPPHLRYICSYFGDEKDTLPDSKINYYKKKDYSEYDYLKTLNVSNYNELGIEIYEKEYLYLSLNLPTTQKFARHLFTNFVPSTINPVYIIDSTSMDIINIVGHDLYNYKSMIQKKKFIDLPEIKKFIDYIIDHKKEYFLIYLHGLFYENISTKQFSIQLLREKSADININPKKNNPELTNNIILEFKDFFAKYLLTNY